MQRTEHRPDDDTEAQRSRPGSRRNSSSLSRRNSIKKEKDTKKKSPINSTPNSSTSTPKKIPKPNLDFVVTGKQILKRCDRANSLPGVYHRRPSTESITNLKGKRISESPKRVVNVSKSSKSRDTSFEDDMSLDLSQVSDFEDTNSKYGIPKKMVALATSTPKSPKLYQKPRSGSLHSQVMRVEVRKSLKSLDSTKQSRDSTFSCSRDSYKTYSTSPQRYGMSTELDYSSVSPEYSGQSSTDLSPRASRNTDLMSPSQDHHVSSCCVSSCQDYSEAENTKIEEYRKGENGEWNNFWANYNNSLAKVPMKSYYDQCPTPYRTDNIDLADLDFSDCSRKRSPENFNQINHIIRNEGLRLTPRETQNIIKCAHILGSVLSRAIDRNSMEKELKAQDVEIDSKKKALTLDLKETNQPIEENLKESVMTQTDISLPNTKSAPRIFEKILRQLSKSSIDETIDKIEYSDNSVKDSKIE